MRGPETGDLGGSRREPAEVAWKASCPDRSDSPSNMLHTVPRRAVIDGRLAALGPARE